MSYEFNPDNPSFELPNPYKVENVSLFISGGVMLAAGLAIVLIVRDRLGDGVNGSLLSVIAIAVSLMLFGTWLFATAFTQLRFFFGRNRPVNLHWAAEVAHGKDGDSMPSQALKETMRQNSLTYDEPRGALNGLLYSWLPHLIFAPKRIQENAQAQFHNFLALVATLISFGMCWLLFGQGRASGWIGIAYAAFSFPLILRPMVAETQASNGQVAGRTTVGQKWLVTLILLAVLGPVVLAMAGSLLPNIGGFSINRSLLVALLAALAGCAVFGLALKNQLQAPPQSVGVARVADTVTMNAHPNKLVEEIDRVMMARWYQNIPNRRYARKSPDIHGQQGRFEAELFEETQPRPQANRTVAKLADAFALPQFRWLAALSALATMYMLAGTLFAVETVNHILDGAPVSSTMGLATSMLAVGEFCRKAAHALWGRFDFVSELVWVEISGSFESARLNVGNQLSGNVQTTKNVINVESMTMRVWVSEIDSVIFGKNAWRQLIGMRGMPQRAEELAGVLKQFGETRSMVVAPTSASDLDRAQRIGAMGKLVGDQATDARGQQELLAQQAQAVVIARDAKCHHCGVALDDDARFCGDCGLPVAAPA
jgi:hypothetical protein